MRWVHHLARMAEWKYVHRVLVGRPEEKRTLGRYGYRWDNDDDDNNNNNNNNKIELQGIEWRLE